SSVHSFGVMHDSTKNWIPNQWVGYSIKNTNPNSVVYNKGSYITSNTSNTITYVVLGSTDRGPRYEFNAGDTYAINRVLTQLDQSGRGKGDQVVASPPINQTTGTPWWTHEALEPCFSWNNVHTPSNDVYGYGSGCPTEIANRDYYNLGAGFPVNTTPSAVYLKYTAALNGGNYVGTFVYPHPLVTAQPLITAQPTSTQCSRLQRRLDRLERRQQRLERRHRSNPRLRKRRRRLPVPLQ